MKREDTPGEGSSTDLGPQPGEQLERGRQGSSGRLDRTEIAELIIEEMARRQGHSAGPYFNCSLATEEFKARFAEAFPQRLPEQSPEEFARRFVDAWPQGLPAQRVVPDPSDPIANPPY